MRTFITLLFLSFSFSVFGQTWDGGGDGISWSDPNNWSGNNLPDDNDDVIISNGDLVIVDYNTNVNLDDLTITGGSTLRITTNGFVDLDGNGLLTVTGGSTLEIAGGELDSDDDIIINGNSNLIVSSGTLDITGDGATIENASITLSGGLIDFGADISLTNTTVNISGGEFNIDGGDFNASGTTVNVSGGFMDLNDDIDLTNSSSFNVSGGLVDVRDEFDVNNSSINLSGGEIDSGTGFNDQIDLVNGASFTMTGGTLDSEDISVENSDFTASGGTIDSNDLFATGTGSVTLSGASTTIDDIDLQDNSVLTVTSGNVLIDDFDMTGDANVSFNGGTVEVDDLITNGNAVFTVDGANTTLDNTDIEGNSILNLNSGNITTTGDLTVNDSGTINISTTVTSNDNNEDIEVFGGGTLNISEGADITGFNDLQFDTGDAAVATVNMTGGNIDIIDDVNLDNSNNDQINISGGTFVVANDIDILGTNATITVTGGSLEAGVIDDTSNGGSTVSDNISVSETGTVSEGGTVVLPVELISFSGQLVGTQVKLSWETAAELNNERFEVEKSTDGKNFITIGVVQGHGTTSALSSYEYVDKSISNGIFYYRLVQYDFDGESEVLPTLSIVNDQAVSISQINVFPNPVIHDQITISLEGQIILKPWTVKIINLQGQIILEANGAVGSPQMKLDNIQRKIGAGNYILHVQGQEESFSRRLIIR